jgi:hypothetical protein
MVVTVIYWGPLSRVFTAWSQTKNPSYLLGALTRVFCHGTDCLVLDQEPQECTGGPRSRLGSLPSSWRMALAAALNSTMRNHWGSFVAYLKVKCTRIEEGSTFEHCMAYFMVKGGPKTSSTPLFKAQISRKEHLTYKVYTSHTMA